MVDHESKIIKITARLIMAICVIFLITIGIRIVTKKVFVNSLHMNNPIIDLIFWDNPSAVVTEFTGNDKMEKVIDWKRRFPFDNTPLMPNVKMDNSIIKKYTKIISRIEKGLEDFTTEKLLGQIFMVEQANDLEHLIGWKLTLPSFGTVVNLNNGYLAIPVAREDVGEILESMKIFSNFLQQQEIGLLYVQVPYKISKYDPELPEGIIDFSNENADRLLLGLQNLGIDTLDLRDSIEKDGLSHYDLFFKTDHHWTPEAALWATNQLIKKLIKDYGFQLDLTASNQDNYYTINYPSIFLGSQGRKVTLKNAKPEDFELLLPDFETNVSLNMPQVKINQKGKFEDLFINYKALEVQSYYNSSAYTSYRTKRQYYVQTKNEETVNKDKKILILRDSFANPVVAFLSLQCGTVEAIDLEFFNGSLESYIKESKPDLVIIMYPPSPSNIKAIDYSTHTGRFDFR